MDLTMHPKSRNHLEIADDGVERRGSARATSYDVARLAGVSQSAVSRAFRDGGSISPRLRARVEKAARELGYAPSLLARSLISRRSNLIGVVMTDLTARNYPDLLRLLGLEIQAAGNRMLLASVPNDAGGAAAAADLLAFHVDGLISSASLPGESLEACERQGVPVVLYNRAPLGAHASAVACDHPAAMAGLFDHLMAGGLGRIAFIAGPERAPVSEDRLASVSGALAKRGLRIECLRHSDYSYEGGAAAARAIFAEEPAPDTIVCANDTMALGVLDALRHDLGLRVPDDVAVAGFDDVPQSAWPSYSLTTLRQPVRRMTQIAMRVLAERLAGEAGPGERRLLPAELRIRGSTRADGKSTAMEQAS